QPAGCVEDERMMVAVRSLSLACGDGGPALTAVDRSNQAYAASINSVRVGGVNGERVVVIASGRQVVEVLSPVRTETAGIGGRIPPRASVPRLHDSIQGVEIGERRARPRDGGIDRRGRRR